MISQKSSTARAELDSSQAVDLMSIKAIDPLSVHRLTSGQVVIDLQTAVKELVENSLDANATIIEVRFKNYGVKSIEVIDNGCGIREQDYDYIALKHHTSKLSSYSDLAAVQTYGFRGEALSSLCTLCSSLTVVTATAEQAPIGTILEFNQDGRPKASRSKTARNKGTTVTVLELFKPLAVRRKEFERNVKREFAKALSVLHAYALVPCTKENNGVRLVVTNQLDKGPRSVQLQTDGSSSLKASVLSLWGPRSFDNLVALDLTFTVEINRSAILQKRGFQQNSIIVKVQGLISKFSLGCGRVTTDRQFFYVNGRPCNLNKIQKVVNEAYRSFNSGQVPFLIADFRLPTDACDINVSPDKRSIFLHNEDALIQSLKISIENTFSSSRSTYTAIPSSMSTHMNEPFPSSETLSSHSNGDNTRKSSESLEPKTPKKGATPGSDKSLSTSVVASSSRSPLSHGPVLSSPDMEDDVIDNEQRQDSIEILDAPQTSVALRSERRSCSPSTDDPDPGAVEPPKKRLKADVYGKTTGVSKPIQLSLDTKDAAWNLRRADKNNLVKSLSAIPEAPASSLPNLKKANAKKRIEDAACDDPQVLTQPICIQEKPDDTSKTQLRLVESPLRGNSSFDELPSSNVSTNLDSPRPDLSLQKTTSTEIIRTAVNKASLKLCLPRLHAVWRRSHLKAAFHNNIPVRISDPLGQLAGVASDTKEAEKELTRVIHKEDFECMQIIGQFNRGFIIARIRRDENNTFPIDDLFIVDQHAADEKYNFESLQRSTKIESQKLLKPQSIELTSAEELVAVENIDVLQDNGFEVQVQEDAAPGSGNRIQLVSQPVSKNTNFDTSDLTELLHLIQESGNKMVRCSKARAMFAMRACRMSVMIGMPLTAKQMIGIIRHMALMEQPWHCPHGRPTMRHLANLHSFDNLKRRIDWTVFAR